LIRELTVNLQTTTDVNETTEATMTDPDTTIAPDTTTDPRGKPESTHPGMPREMLLLEEVTRTGVVAAVAATTDRGTERTHQNGRDWRFSIENGNPCVGASGAFLRFLSMFVFTNPYVRISDDMS
jgi:hypothetical protein